MGSVIFPLTLIYQGHSLLNLIIVGFGGFTLLTPVLIHWIAKGYVSHLYFNRDTDTYTAWTYTFFLRRKRLQFTPDDVEVPAVRNILTAFTAKGVPLMVDESRLGPSDLYHLRGYDKGQSNVSMEDLRKMFADEEGVKKQ